MAFYLIIRKEEGDSHSQAFKFNQHAITIGSDLSNNLRLSGGNKSIAPIHAEILLKHGKYYLADYGSKEGIFIGRQKLTKKQSYLLQEGCTFQIGRYFLKFSLQGDVLKTGKQKTKKLQTAINILAESLENLNQTLQSDGKNDDSFSGQKLFEMLEDEQPGSARTLAHLLTPARTRETVTTAASCHENADFIIDMFFKLFVGVFEVSVNISHAFIDPKTVHRKDSKQLLSSENLKKYLLEEKLLPDERDKRRAFLSAEVDDLISRQTAIFAGYQKSIKYGIKDLFRELDPVSIFKNERDKMLHIGPINISKKKFPFLVERKAMRDIINTYRTISRQNPEEIEQKYFHPAFISGYLNHINANRRERK